MSEVRKSKKMEMKEKVRISIYAVTLFFGIIILTTSLLWVVNQFEPGNQKYYHEWNWFVYVGFGALSVFALLMHTMTLERPFDFSRLRVFEFFAISVLLVSLGATVVFFPTHIFPDDMGVQKLQQEIEQENENVTISEWVLSIGGVEDKETGVQKGRTGLSVPIYVLVAGIAGAYIRYVYSYIKGDTKKDKKDLNTLYTWIFNYRKAVNSLCISSGLKYFEIKKMAEGEEILEIKYLHEIFDLNRKYIYFLPPHSTAKLAEYVAACFEQLYDYWEAVERKKVMFRYETYIRTITTVGSLILAPILAIVAWLFLGWSGTTQWEAFAIVSFGAGLGTRALIDRIWSFMNEQFRAEDKNQDEEDEDEEDKEDSGNLTEEEKKLLRK